MSVALTNQVQYTLKPTSVKCARRQLLIPSSNKSSFSPSDTAVFYIPSLANQCMDGQSSYLRFTATITGNGFVDNTAQSFINRIQTYGAGGQLVSDINNYCVLASLMTDLQLSQSEKVGLSATLGSEDTYFTPTAGALATPATPTAAEVAALVPNANRKGRPVANGTSYTFCIPLIHPFFSLAEKYYPAFALSDDTRLEITWSSAVQALVAATDYTISNPELLCEFIEFDSAVMSMIQQTYSGSDLILASQDYRFYTNTINAGTTGNVSYIIPTKQQSARAFFFCPRPAETQAVAGYSSSSRVNPFSTAGDYFNLNIGGMKVPPHPIRTRIGGNHAEWFASTQTALHAFNSLEMNGSLNRTYYGAYSDSATHKVGADSFQNGFALGINLDTLRGQSTSQNSGMNLSAITTYWEGFIGNTAKNSGNNAENITMDTFLLHDVLFVISGGQMSLRM